MNVTLKSFNSLISGEEFCGGDKCVYAMPDDAFTLWLYSN